MAVATAEMIPAGIHAAVAGAAVEAVVAVGGAVAARAVTGRCGRRVMHAVGGVVHVAAAKTTVPMRTTSGVEPAVVVVSAVSAPIGDVHTRTAVVVVAAVVVAVDGEMPRSSPPDDGAEEVVSSRQQRVLPVVEDAAEVVEAIAVVASVDVRRRINPEEVVEIDFVGIVILLVVEVKLIGHLVRQVESFCLSTSETHCIGACESCHGKHHGK